MTKRAEVGLKTVFFTNSCTLLKMAKKWCAQFENHKTCACREENVVLYKLMYFAQWCAQCTKRADVRRKTLFCTNSWLKSRLPNAGMSKRADLLLNSLLCTISCSLLKIAKKWCAQCGNDKTC